MKRIKRVSLALLPLLALGACTNTVKYDDKPAAKTVQQDLGTQILQSSVISMTDTMLEDSSVQALSSSKRPMLAVFGMINFTSDEVDLTAINSELMSSLYQSNQFRFVDIEKMDNASQEWQKRLYDLFEDPANASQLSTAVNADYLLVGEISNVIRTSPHQKKVFYRLTLKLLDKKKEAFIWQNQRELLKSEKKVVYGV